MAQFQMACLKVPKPGWRHIEHHPLTECPASCNLFGGQSLQQVALLRLQLCTESSTLSCEVRALS